MTIITDWQLLLQRLCSAILPELHLRPFMWMTHKQACGACTTRHCVLSLACRGSHPEPGGGGGGSGDCCQ